jgi:hypothetical protein
MPGFAPGILRFAALARRAAIVNEILIRAVPSRHALTITVKK